MTTNRRNFLLTTGALLLSGCESAPSVLAPTAPTTAGAFPLIADTATRLTAVQARALLAQGVQTVFRYYCHLPPSLPGKDLQPEEVKIILGEGLSIGSVFQHYNNCFRTFENRWGREDAEQALRMAHAAGQPSGSAIYFGVDGDWPYQSMRDPIIVYFEDVKRAFEGSGYSIGLYSNGCLCNAVREKSLADHFWLSGSTGHSGTQAFYNTGKWTLFQNALELRPASLDFDVDTNLSNPTTNGDFGQWNDRGVVAHKAPETNAVFAARRFLNANTDIKASPDSTSVTLANVRKDQNVRIVQSNGAWIRILTQEGGSRGGTPPAEGWVSSTALVAMDRFAGNSSDYGLCGLAAIPTDTAKYQNCERATSRNR